MKRRRAGESGTRRRGKDDRHKHGGRPTFERRTPPPEETGRESDYLSRRKGDRTPVAIQLLSGETVCGVIEYYDRDMIKIVPSSGPTVFIRKAQIRLIEEL